MWSSCGARGSPKGLFSRVTRSTTATGMRARCRCASTLVGPWSGRSRTRWPALPRSRRRRAG
eukprot:401991-Lingulodinium_polyedra.AAC.1